MENKMEISRMGTQTEKNMKHERTGFLFGNILGAIFNYQRDPYVHPQSLDSPHIDRAAYKRQTKEGYQQGSLNTDRPRDLRTGLRDSHKD